jgi:elongation factor Ts
LASEGLIAIAAIDNRISMVEVNCETDFVALNPEFQALTKDLAGRVLQSGASSDEVAKSVESLVNEKIATIGEKIAFRRSIFLSGGSAYGQYMHGQGSIGAVVELQLADGTKANSDAIRALAKDLAMHVAAATPLFLDRAAVDAKTIESERHIFSQQVLAQGKPANMIDRIVDGKIEKYFSEVCLLEQKFVKDPDMSINKLLNDVSKSAGTPITLTRFARFKVGEGLEKKADDFAQEVARMTA